MLQEEWKKIFAKDYVSIIGLNQVHYIMVCIAHLHTSTLQYMCMHTYMCIELPESFFGAAVETVLSLCGFAE